MPNQHNFHFRSHFFSALVVTLFFSLQSYGRDLKNSSLNHVLICSADLPCKPSPELLELLSALKVTHEGSLQSIVAATQKKWLRPKGSERWQMKDAYNGQRRKLLPLLVNLGLVEGMNAQKSQYDYAVVLGATTNSVRDRLRFLIRTWQHGIRFREIVFLGSARLLDPRLEPIPRWRHKAARPKTETDMMKIVFAQTKVPKGWQAIKVRFVDAPAKPDGAGGMRRPNTADTVEAWLKESPTPGTVLAISNQPFVLYQHAVLTSLLPRTFSVDSAGSRADPKVSIALCLDSLARLLYQTAQEQNNL